MKKKFIIDEKQVVTTTHVTTYEVEADSYEEALQFVQDGNTKSINEDCKNYFNDTEYELTGVEEIIDSTY